MLSILPFMSSAFKFKIIQQYLINLAPSLTVFLRYKCFFLFNPFKWINEMIKTSSLPAVHLNASDTVFVQFLFSVHPSQVLPVLWEGIECQRQQHRLHPHPGRSPRRLRQQASARARRFAEGLFLLQFYPFVYLFTYSCDLAARGSQHCQTTWVWRV